jgi:hypothetical protein
VLYGIQQFALSLNPLGGGAERRGVALLMEAAEGPSVFQIQVNSQTLCCSGEIVEPITISFHHDYNGVLHE